MPRAPRTTTLTPRVDNRWRGLTPPPDRRTPGTELITPDLPPPGPLFRKERGPRAVGRHVPPSPKDHNPYPYERIPVAARRSSVQSVRGLVNSPTTPWSREAGHGSDISVPGDHLFGTPNSNVPTEGSLISDPAGTMTIKDNGQVSPISSRRTFPGKVRHQVSAPYSTRTDPVEVRGRRVPKQRPPHTTWSSASVKGSVVAPGWGQQRLVNDPDNMDTNLWVRRHNGQNGDLVQRPLFIANDLEIDRDFIVTPRGTKRYITRNIPPDTIGDLNEIHSNWVPPGYYEEPSYPRVKRIHRLNDPDHMSLPDPHIIDVPPHVPVHHYRPYSLPSYVGRDPRQYPPRTFVPHRDLKPRPPPPSSYSDESGVAHPARLVELTPDGPRDMPKLAATVPDERSLDPNQGSIRAGRNDSRLEHLRGAHDHERYRRRDYLPKWGYYVETPPSPGQSLQPRQGSIVDPGYQKRQVPLNRGMLSPRSITKSMRAEHGSTITTASEKSEKREKPERRRREVYGDDDYGDGYRGNQAYDQGRAPDLGRAPNPYNRPNQRPDNNNEMKDNGEMKRGRFNNRRNNGGRRVRVQGRNNRNRNEDWGRKFAQFSEDARFPFSLRGFLKVAQMIISLIIIILAFVDNTKWSASIFVASIGIIGFVVALCSFGFRFLGYHTTAALPCLWFELIVYGVVVIGMLAAGILSAISATVAGTVAAVTFFCFLATVVFAFDAVLMAQVAKERNNRENSDPDDDRNSQDGDRRDKRDPREARDRRSRDDRREPQDRRSRDDRRDPRDHRSRDDRREPQDRRSRGDPNEDRRGPRDGRREDFDRRSPPRGRDNRGYDERY